MSTFIEILKEKFFANVVSIVIILFLFIYLLATGDEDVKIILVFLSLFPFWLGFTYGFISIVFDWKLMGALRKQVLVNLSLGLLVPVVLFYFGWREEIFFMMAISAMVGLVFFIVEKVFSIGRR